MPSLRGAQRPLAPPLRPKGLGPASFGQTPFGPGNWSWSISLEDFLEFDPDASIGSPRSLEALRSEGLEGQEVIYRPIESFQASGLDPAIVRLRHDFCEARRQDLLDLARAARAELISLEEGRPPPRRSASEISMQRLAGADFADCPRTKAFFTHWQGEFNRFNVAAMPIANWPPEGEAGAENTPDVPEVEQVDDLEYEALDDSVLISPASALTRTTSLQPEPSSAALARTWTLEAASDGGALETGTSSCGAPSAPTSPKSQALDGVPFQSRRVRPTSGTSSCGVPSVPISPQTQALAGPRSLVRSPSARSVPWSVCTSALDGPTPSLGSSASEPMLRWKLNEALKAPHADRVDEEMVRKTEELLLTQRKADFAKQKVEHEAQLHTVKKMEKLAHSAMDRALKVETRKHHMRQYRSEMFDLSEDCRTQAHRHYKNMVMAPDGIKSLFSVEGSQAMSVLVPAMCMKRGLPPVPLEVSTLRSTPTGQEKAKHWEEQVRQNNIDLDVGQALRKLELAESRTNVSNERLKRLLKDKTSRSMQFAQDQLQARINWRHGYGEVLRKREAYEAGRKSTFQKKQARFAEWLQQADTAAGLRKELGELRRIHRLLNSRQRRRKQEYVPSPPEQPPERKVLVHRPPEEMPVSRAVSRGSVGGPL